MVLGTLQQVPETFVNRLSSHFDSDEDDDMFGDASPCRPMRMMSMPSSSTSSLPMPSFSYRNRTQLQSLPKFGDLEMPLPLFRNSFRHQSSDSVKTLQSVTSEHSLMPSSSSELDSEADAVEDLSRIEASDLPRLTIMHAASQVTLADSFGKSTANDSADLAPKDPCLDEPPRPQLSPNGLFDLDSTPLARPHLLRSSRYHRVHHSTTEISTSLFTARRHANKGQEQPDENMPYAPTGSSRGAHSTPFWLPSSKVRRTQSMFVTPEQMLHDLNSNVEVTAAAVNAAIDFDGVSQLESPQCPVPTFNVKQDPFPRISAATLCRLLDREFASIYSEVVVIDCRFEYEFEGGHIDGAINVNSKQQLEQTMFHQRACDPERRVLLIFHCEHSAYRSPMLASHLRHCDRDMNASRYPSLFYPDVAVLDGGYSEFYAAAAERCVPQNYVGMDHHEHQRTCEREMSRFRTGMKSRKFSSMGMVSAPDLTSFRFPSRTSRVITETEETQVTQTGRSASAATLPPRSSLFDI